MTRSRSGRYDDPRDDPREDDRRGYRRDARTEAGRYPDRDYANDRGGARGSGARGSGARGGGDRGSGGRGGGPGDGKGPGGGSGIQLNMASAAVLAGVLVVGIGIGSAVTSTTQGNQGNIASSQQLDMAVADPEFCRQWGASAFVMEVQMYTTMNPSSSFVTQPKLQPGCVIRRENWSVLQKEGAVSNEQMRQCKQRMNTFAYIGSVKDKPEVRCVYQTDIVDNKFVTKGIAEDTSGLTPEADQF